MITKKILAFFLSVSIACGALAGCGNGGKKENGGDGDGISQTDSENGNSENDNGNDNDIKNVGVKESESEDDDSDNKKTTVNNADSDDEKDNFIKLTDRNGNEIRFDPNNKGELRASTENPNGKKIDFDGNGSVYELPIVLAELLADGWTGNVNFEAILDANRFTNISLIKNGAYIDVDVHNSTDTGKPLRECVIKEVNFANTDSIRSFYYAESKYILPGGICEKSNLVNVYNVFGFTSGNRWFDTVTAVFRLASTPEEKDSYAIGYVNNDGYGYSFYFDSDFNITKAVVTAE